MHTAVLIKAVCYAINVFAKLTTLIIHETDRRNGPVMVKL